MKRIVYILLFSVCFSVKAQVNLVPNPSFEDTIPCTTGSIGINLAAVGWYMANQSPDYYNSAYSAYCGYNVNYSPNNIWGNQMPLDGNAYVGFSTYCVPAYCGLSNYREWTQTQLSSPLISNKNYLVSFFVNLAHNTDYATDDIGAAITTSTTIPLGYPNQIENQQGNFITDTINWTLITGIMNASGGEQYITIGNFKTDANTTVIINTPSSGNPGTYYFADMVSIYQLPDIEAGVSDTICLGDTVHLNASYANGWAGLKYRWFPSIGLNDTTILNPVATPTVTTTYHFGLIDTTGTIPGMINYVDSLTIVVGCAGVEEYGNDAFGKMYPNPANTMAYYEFDRATNESARLEIYDLLGKKVNSQKLNSGSKKTEIDLSQISSGIYAYKIFINNVFKASNKLIIAK